MTAETGSRPGSAGEFMRMVAEKVAEERADLAGYLAGWIQREKDRSNDTMALALTMPEWERIVRALRSESAPSRDEIIEKCAKHIDGMAQHVYDEYGSTDQETGERMVPTSFMDTVEAYEDSAFQLRALKDAAPKETPESAATGVAAAKRVVDGPVPATTPGASTDQPHPLLEAWNALSEHLESEYSLSSIENKYIARMAEEVEKASGADRRLE